MSVYAEKRDGKPTGRWIAEVQVDGKPRKTRADTYELALAKEKELRAGRPEANLDHNPVTLRSLVDRYKANIWGKSDKNTLSTTKMEVIIKFFGAEKKLKDITALDIEKLGTHLESIGKAVATVNRYYSALSKALKYAARHKWITEVPAFDWRDEDEGRIREVTVEEETKLLALMKSYGADDVAAFIEVAVDTGARRSEIMKASTVLDGDWVRIWQTKNGSPRSVPASPRVKARWALARTVSAARLRYFWDKAREEMGLAQDCDFVVHALRHTFPTRALRQGVNVLVLKKWLGHKRIETTLRYAHVFDEDLSAAARRLWGE